MWKPWLTVSTTVNIIECGVESCWRKMVLSVNIFWDLAGKQWAGVPFVKPTWGEY
jgi:hypothetical protein